ncbi:hypothetical protein [Streptomyces sp. A012304]|uniref:hypothetical protein n=1 Tax=Streptomyces sp. A012304 TaxID=375446 RepID=UPI002230D03B|nr:hypothetical protein [Streptomyces sp. A012304]GKQ36664.1 hypothetical protein ALMP_32040 [Streptomyces sp. A012304]
MKPARTLGTTPVAPPPATRPGVRTAVTAAYPPGRAREAVGGHGEGGQGRPRAPRRARAGPGAGEPARVLGAGLGRGVGGHPRAGVRGAWVR